MLNLEACTTESIFVSAHGARVSLVATDRTIIVSVWTGKDSPDISLDIGNDTHTVVTNHVPVILR